MRECVRAWSVSVGTREMVKVSYTHTSRGRPAFLTSSLCLPSSPSKLFFLHFVLQRWMHLFYLFIYFGFVRNKNPSSPCYCYSLFTLLVFPFFWRFCLPSVSLISLSLCHFYLFSRCLLLLCPPFFLCSPLPSFLLSVCPSYSPQIVCLLFLLCLSHPPHVSFYLLFLCLSLSPFLLSLYFYYSPHISSFCLFFLFPFLLSACLSHSPHISSYLFLLSVHLTLLPSLFLSFVLTIPVQRWFRWWRG